MRDKYGYGLDSLAPNFNRGSDCFCVKCAQNCRQASGYGAATSPKEKAAPKEQAVSASGMPRGEDLDRRQIYPIALRCLRREAMPSSGEGRMRALDAPQNARRTWQCQRKGLLREAGLTSSTVGGILLKRLQPSRFIILYLHPVWSLHKAWDGP